MSLPAADPDASSAPNIVENKQQAANLLENSMREAGYLPDGETDEGMPKKHQEFERALRKVLEFLKNTA